MGSHEARMETFREKKAHAMQMGGEKKLAYYRDNGWL